MIIKFNLFEHILLIAQKNSASGKVYKNPNNSNTSTLYVPVNFP